VRDGSKESSVNIPGRVQELILHFFVEVKGENFLVVMSMTIIQKLDAYF